MVHHHRTIVSEGLGDDSIRRIARQQSRHPLRYSSRQHWQKSTAQLRRIYTAATLEAAEFEFEAIRDEGPDGRHVHCLSAVD